MKEIKYTILYCVLVRTFVKPFYICSGTVLNYGSGSEFLTSYASGSGSTRQKDTVPTIPVPVPFYNTDQMSIRQLITWHTIEYRRSMSKSTVECRRQIFDLEKETRWSKRFLMRWVESVSKQQQNNDSSCWRQHKKVFDESWQISAQYHEKMNFC